MEHILTRPFSITRDFKSIAWGATLWHNLLRSFCAGLVFSILGFFLGAPKSEGIGILVALPFLLPIGYLLVYMPIGLFCAFLSRFIPFIGLISFACALCVLPGDPIVWFISLIFPSAVPLEKPGFLNFALIMWVLKPEDAMEITITNTSRAKVL